MSDDVTQLSIATPTTAVELTRWNRRALCAAWPGMLAARLEGYAGDPGIKDARHQTDEAVHKLFRFSRGNS
jgi:hypothetical protein